MKILYFTNIILDISNPIVLVRAATETECENGPVQSPLPRLFSFAESSKNRMVHAILQNDKSAVFYGQKESPPRDEREYQYHPVLERKYLL